MGNLGLVYNLYLGDGCDNSPSRFATFRPSGSIVKKQNSYFNYRSLSNSENLLRGSIEYVARQFFKNKIYLATNISAHNFLHNFSFEFTSRCQLKAPSQNNEFSK